KTPQEYSLSSGYLPNSLQAVDLNRDGRLDLVVSCGQICVLLGNGDGTFGNVTTYSSGGNQYTDSAGIAVADLNEDGVPDLAVTNWSGTSGSSVGILLGKGDGSFKSAVTYLTNDYAYRIVAGDLNGDGHQDLALTKAQIGSNGKLIVML